MVAIGAAPPGSNTRRAQPQAFGPAAAAQRHHLALQLIILIDEQRPLQQPDLLIGEQADRRALDGSGSSLARY